MVSLMVFSLSSWLHWESYPESSLSLDLSAGLSHARVVRIDHSLDAVSEIELEQEVRDVCLHGALADDELPGDLRVRETARDEPEHLSLPRGQLVERGNELSTHRGFGRELLDYGSGDRGVEQCIPTSDDMNSRNELLGRHVLEQEAARAGT